MPSNALMQVLVVSHDEAFVSVACDSIAEVAGGRRLALVVVAC